MTDVTQEQPVDDDEPTRAHVDERATLLPEERAVGSDDPQAQAQAILEESIERTEHPDAQQSVQSAMDTRR